MDDAFPATGHVTGTNRGRGTGRLGKKTSLAAKSTVDEVRYPFPCVFDSNSVIHSQSRSTFHHAQPHLNPIFPCFYSINSCPIPMFPFCHILIPMSPYSHSRAHTGQSESCERSNSQTPFREAVPGPFHGAAVRGLHRPGLSRRHRSSEGEEADQVPRQLHSCETGRPIEGCCCPNCGH